MIAEDPALFDYETKAFGTGTVRVSPTYIPALKLKYALQSVEGVRGRVLDLACGGGGMTKAIAMYRPDLEIVGCDLSMRSLAIAQENGQGPRFSAGNVFQLPFPHNSFDAVVMFDFLEHLSYPANALKEVHRVLKPQGIFHTAVPFEGEPSTLHGMLWRLGWKAKEIHCGHVQMYEYGQPEAIIEEAGFRIVDTEWTAHWIYQVADVCYFSWLYLRGKGVPYSIEGYLEVAKPSLKSRSVFLAKALVATLSYLESSVLHWFPAGFGHITCLGNENGK